LDDLADYTRVQMAQLRINWALVATWSVGLTVALATAVAYPVWLHHRHLARQVQAPPAPITVDKLMAHLPAIDGAPISVCGRLDKGFEGSDLWRGHLEPVPNLPGVAFPPAVIWVGIGPSTSSFLSAEQILGRAPT